MSVQGKSPKGLASRIDNFVVTASRAISGHDRIAVKTRQQVKEAAREIGYVPNRAAGAMVSNPSGFAELAFWKRGYGQEDVFLEVLVAGLILGFGRLGVDRFLTAVPNGKSELSVIPNVGEARRVDSLELARVEEEDPRFDYLIERGFPFVAHGILDETSAYSWFDTDRRTAFAETFELLYRFSHRDFGVATITEAMTFRRERSAGLARAIARRGDRRFDRPARAANIRRLLNRPDRPTATIRLFGSVAISVMQEAMAMRLSIPDDFVGGQLRQHARRALCAAGGDDFRRCDPRRGGRKLRPCWCGPSPRPEARRRRACIARRICCAADTDLPRSAETP